MNRLGRILPVTVLLLTSAAGFADEPTTHDPLLVDDFEDRDLESHAGLSWIVIADDQRGGLSTGSLSVVTPGAGGSGAALRFDGELREGIPFPFAGAWALVHEAGLPGDVSGYRGLRFYARGATGRFQAGLRQSRGGSGTSFMTPVDVSEEWSLVEIPFSGLERYPPIGPNVDFDPGAVVMLGVSTMPGQSGGFALEIDRVELYQ